MIIITFLFVFLFALFFIKLCKNRSLFLSIGIIFFIELSWQLISCGYLDFGNAFISEIGRNSYHTGALLRMIILYLPFIIVVTSKSSGIISNKFRVKLYFKKIKTTQCIRVILILTLIVIFYCIINMIISGVPIFSPTVTRINFGRYSKLPFAVQLNGEITFFGIFIAGIAYFFESDKKNKKIAMAILILSILYRILMEYKYHGMYNVIFAFFCPAILRTLEKKDYHIIELKTILKISFIFSLILSLCYGTYKIVNKNTDTKTLLFDRIFSLQAHTFWGIDEIAYVKDKNLFGYSNSLNGEVSAVLFNKGQSDKNSGIIDVMYKISNPITVNANINNGVRWAGSYLTIGINTIGYFFTFILSFLLGILLVFDMKMLYCSMKNKEFICLYLSQSILWDILDYFRIGNWCLLINLKTIFFFSILLFIFLYKSKNNYIINKGDQI